MSYSFTILGCVLIAMLCAASAETQSKDRIPGENYCPLDYNIDSVSIRLTRQPARTGFIESVSLFGNGRARIEHGGKLRQFDYPPSDLIPLLNELYKIRFFDLPSNYTTRYSVFLKSDGTVGMSALRLSDATSTRLCVDIGEYEKCVTFGRDGPLELQSIAKKLFTNMEKYTGS